MRTKWVKEMWPSDLDEVVRGLNYYPRSLRLANELYTFGIPLMKEHGLYIPLLPYMAMLGYMPASDSRAVSLMFDRHWKHGGYDALQAIIFTPEEKIGVTVVRTHGARRARDRKATLLSVLGYKGILDYLDAILRRSPSEVFTSKLGPDGESEGITRYDLLT
ncbi:MAG: hypothetical protein AABW49_04775 [Nanoarchaeota archaeon]